MSIIYTSKDNNIFYVKDRYQVDQQDWIRYTNHLGEEFTCHLEAFNERFRPAQDTSVDASKTLASLKNGFK